MNREKIATSRSLFARFFCILITLIFLVKAESTIYAPIEFCYYCPPTEIELVVTPEIDYDLALFKVDVPQKQYADFAVHINFESIYTITAIYYDSYVRHLLKSFKRAFSSNLELISILQRYNVWHQSSDEEHFLVSRVYCSRTLNMLFYILTGGLSHVT